MLPNFKFPLGVINHLHHIRIENKAEARTLINHLKPSERELLLDTLKERAEPESKKDEDDDGHVSYAEVKQLFVYNTLPFIGFGILDNMIMILGEAFDELTSYIEQLKLVNISIRNLAPFWPYLRWLLPLSAI